MSEQQQDRAAVLRAALKEAVRKGSGEEALAALEELEALESADPRWPHQQGVVHQQFGRHAEAEQAFTRAMERFAQAGYLPQAVAMAKRIVALNPKRADLLDHIDQRPAQTLRSGPGAGGALVDAAKPLRPAADAADDEVRFDDASVVVGAAAVAPDIEVMAADDADREAIRQAEAQGLDAERLAQLSAVALLADVSQPVLGELARAAELQTFERGEPVVRQGESADTLYVIVEGTARVALSWRQSGVDLAAGQVFGEAALLQEGKRHTDVWAETDLVLLGIATADLHRIMSQYPELRSVLFDLLARRLAANALQTSPLFAAFDREHRMELARMFEVRRALPGVALQQAGKRSDGLYLLLMGTLVVRAGQLFTRLRPGSMFGYRSLLSRAPVERTITAESECIVLRLAAKRFSAFAMQYPPALDHLAELAGRPGPLTGPAT